MIVISTNLVLSPTLAPLLNLPIFGWRNLVTAANVDATSEEADYPASNVANPSTALRWRGEVGSPPADEYLTSMVESVEPLDYVAIAGHNFGSAQIPVSIEGATQIEGSPPELDWQEIVQDVLLPNDGPVIFRFEPQSLLAVRLRMQPGAAPPTAAVMYAGKLLVCERSTGQDHTPVNFGRRVNVMSGRSETGNFLGRVVLGEHRATSFALQRVRASWFRSEMDPFLIDAKERPFFFAWKPQEHPHDVGFCWLTGDPQVVREFDTGTMAVSLDMNGVA